MSRKQKIEEFVGTGRRKCSVASVRLRRGSGNVNINGKELANYLPVDVQRSQALAPIHNLGVESQYDLIIRAKGGGIQGQVEAIRLGIARALIQCQEEAKADFKSSGFLTRDPRKKERKKYGQPGARKKFQFSKR